MSSFQLTTLASAAAFCLISTVIVFLVVRLVLTFFLKPPPAFVRSLIAFLVTWLVVAFYLPFKSVSYYVANSQEMYIAELLVSALALYAVTKLSPAKAK